MYLFNPIWASNTLWEDPDSDLSMDFSDEVMKIPNRLSLLPFNESLYQLIRMPSVHHQVYYNDLVNRFKVSSVASMPFKWNGKSHWVCSVGVGEEFNTETVVNQLKFLTKGNALYSISDWHQQELVGEYTNNLIKAKSVTEISLDELIKQLN